METNDVDLLLKQIAELQAEVARLKKTQLINMDITVYKNDLCPGKVVRGYYIDLPELYCDVAQDENGLWSIFFRDNIGGNYVFADQAKSDAPQPETELNEKGK